MAEAEKPFQTVQDFLYRRTCDFSGNFSSNLVSKVLGEKAKNEEFVSSF
jgi:hypothetical protein